MTDERAGTDDAAITVSVGAGEDAIRLLIAGELDMGSAATVVDAARALALDARPVTVDLGGLTFVDSAGLRALLAVHEHVVAATDGPARLAGLSDEHLTLIELCGLDDVFEIDRPA